MKNLKKMNNVGIVTLYYNNYNFGGLLQAYALQKIIETQGYICEQIKVDFESDRLSRYKEIIRNSKGVYKINYYFRYAFFGVAYYFNKIMARCLRLNLEKKEEAFKRFEDNIPHSVMTYNKETIYDAIDKYDIFVCGSDVVWHNDGNPMLGALGFVPVEKLKIAYAASTGSGTLSIFWHKKYDKYLKEFKAISVREDSIRKELEDDYDVKCVLDPTLLLSKGEWEMLIDDCISYKNYIFCYLLGTSNVQRKAIEKFAKKYNLELVVVPYTVENKFRLCDLNFGNKQEITGKPGIFLELISKASLVITDSFHGVVFSVIFNKCFYAIKRYNKETVCADTLGRVTNLLKMLKLDDREIENEQIEQISIKPIDYEDVNQILGIQREKSLIFLKNSLQGNC